MESLTVEQRAARVKLLLLDCDGASFLDGGGWRSAITGGGA